MSQTPKRPLPHATPSLRERAETLRARVPERPADPVLIILRDGRKLLQACQKARLLPDAPDGTGSYGRPRAENEATDALMDHLRGPLLETVPETPIGAIALAKYAIEVQRLLGVNLEDEMLQILTLIARVQLV